MLPSSCRNSPRFSQIDTGWTTQITYTIRCRHQKLFQVVVRLGGDRDLLPAHGSVPTLNARRRCVKRSAGILPVNITGVSPVPAGPSPSPSSSAAPQVSARPTGPAVPIRLSPHGTANPTRDTSPVATRTYIRLDPNWLRLFTEAVLGKCEVGRPAPHLPRHLTLETSNLKPPPELASFVRPASDGNPGTMRHLAAGRLASFGAIVGCVPRTVPSALARDPRIGFVCTIDRAPQASIGFVCSAGVRWEPPNDAPSRPRTDWLRLTRGATRPNWLCFFSSQLLSSPCSRCPHVVQSLFSLFPFGLCLFRRGHVSLSQLAVRPTVHHYKKTPVEAHM